MKLFLVHCGFYDSALCDGIYESHANFLVAATDFADARTRAKELPEYKAHRMHVDGVQEIQAVSGHTVELNENPQLAGKTVLLSQRHRDLAANS